MTKNSLNQGLAAAKAAKKDEFYTQYVDIQKEVEAYMEFDPDTFRDKVVYCNGKEWGQSLTELTKPARR